MSAALTIVRKELRALFQSPIAIIFLGVFLVATLFLFFTQARFFARNLADVRPLFEWLPLLLIFLVSAITMRSWAEERKAGTLEVLLTLPIRTVNLVLGKFLAGMGLVALALAFTLPLPVTVAMLGPLDWGPVIGGYFAALLLASAYMAIGLCVSARTDNQVVALMTTVVLGGLLWLIGTDTVVDFFSAGTAETLRAFGTGSRFESVERGVLDIRDIVYYGTLTAFFLVLNGVFLERERIDPGSKPGRAKSAALMALVVLTACNAALLNVWLSPVHRVRIDLTSGQDYTISTITRQVMANLDEPMKIRAFISSRTHPALAPLVPQIRDTLAEYEIYSSGNVTVEVMDPNDDEELEAEINEQYSIRPIPFGVSDRHSQSVVNAYFHVLIEYGDQHEVLSFQDLIEVRMDPTEGMNVKLRNLEYDLTRAMKKVSQEFQTIESLVAKLPEPAKVTAYVTPASLPEGFQDAVGTIQAVGNRLQASGNGRVTFTEVDPSPDMALMQSLAEDYGIQPLAADLFGAQRFYLHLLIEVGDHAEAILPRGELTENEIQQAIEAALRRATPGQLKKVALFTEVPVAVPNPQLPPQAQPRPADPDYRSLERLLTEHFTVERTELKSGWVQQDVDVLVVGKTGKLDPKQQFAVDQYLMRGGAVVVLAGAYRVKADRQGIGTIPEDPALFDLLQTYGVKVDSGLVLDRSSGTFPVPTMRSLPGGQQIQMIDMVPYPFFVDVRGSGLNNDHASMSGINSIVLPWVSPVTATAEDLPDREVEWLLQSSGESWYKAGGTIEPDTTNDDGPKWDDGTDMKVHNLAMAVAGRFPSHFAELPNPLAEDPSQSPDHLKNSVADGRLVVIGTSEVVSDINMQIAQSSGQQAIMSLQLVQNLIDWSVEDTDLLQIRTAGAFARTLKPLEVAESRAVEIRTWLMVLFPILFVLLVPRIRRRSTKAVPLTPAVEPSK